MAFRPSAPLTQRLELRISERELKMARKAAALESTEWPTWVQTAQFMAALSLATGNWPSRLDHLRSIEGTQRRTLPVAGSVPEIVRLAAQERAMTAVEWMRNALERRAVDGPVE